MRSIIILFLIAVTHLQAQDNFSLNVGEIKERTYHSKFDFESIKGKIIIDVKFNNKVRKFILDTGAPTSISENLLVESGYKEIQRLPIRDANGKDSEIDIIQLPEFSIGSITFVDSYALKLTDMSLFDCFGVEGIIGSNSLRNSVVEFDFKNKKITLTENVKNLGYSKLKPKKLHFYDQQSSPVLDLKMKLGHLSFNEEVMFDSGDDSFYSLSNRNLTKLLEAIEQKQIPVELQNTKTADLLGIIASSNGTFSLSLNGNANQDEYYKFKIQEFIFGTTRFDNVIATTTFGTNSRVGAEILNHGKLTLDYKRKKYYFQPYDSRTTIDVKHKFESFFPTYEKDKFIVGIIWDEKIKDKVKVGDEILKINEVDFSKFSKCEIFISDFSDLKKASALKLTLKDVENGEIKEVELQN